jgi:hypothetical protein
LNKYIKYSKLKKKKKESKLCLYILVQILNLLLTK